MVKLKRVILFFILVFQKWTDDRAPRMAAALAYYTMFSLAPLVVILLAVVGRFLSAQRILTDIMGQIESFVGADADSFIRSIIENASQPTSVTVATLISVAVTLWGASNVFNHLYETLNIIWGVKPKPERSTFWHFVRKRLLSFGVVLFAGVLLVVYVIANTVIPLLVKLVEQLLTIEFLNELFPGDLLSQIADLLNAVQIGQYVAAFLVLILMLALFFKILPDVQIGWRDVWVGAFFTAVMITLGTLAMGIYFRVSSLSSIYGAAGSVMVILAWFYYSAQIFLFGAEFTEVYARWYGGRIEPADYAVSAEEEQNLKTELEDALPQPLYRFLVDEESAMLERARTHSVDEKSPEGEKHQSQVLG
ncbi:MAG: YihY/virulence factor BrkB family protein [Candidatus Promineifilaceae bacterium]|nr:YihY/virulence factor BrkB family protein [Candidatus Promineifilaceae bacterium]